MVAIRLAIGLTLYTGHTNIVLGGNTGLPWDTANDLGIPVEPPFFFGKQGNSCD